MLYSDNPKFYFKSGYNRSFSLKGQYIIYKIHNTDRISF